MTRGGQGTFGTSSAATTSEDVEDRDIEPLADEVVVSARGVGKVYRLYDRPQDRLKHMVFSRIGRSYGREFWALRDVSFDVRRGEVVGIIGRNGSGKSTLLQILAGILQPATGVVRVRGRVAALLELGSGFNPEFTGRENVFLYGRILGLSQKIIDARHDQIVAFADIGDFIDQPVKTYSSGMFVRLAFAVQAHIDASIVIIDEALAVGDVFFMQRCYRRLHDLVESGVAVILVSHDMATVTQFCSEALLLDQGQVMYRGNPVSAIRKYMALQRGAVAGTRQPAELTSALVESADATPRSQDGFRWPLGTAFLNTSGADIVGNGQAEFLGVAVCAIDGEASQVFQIGEAADFYYAFRLLEDIGAPIGGITLVNERNIIVHGKSSMQHQLAVPLTLPRGTTLRFRQRIVLDVAPGEYTFVVGLATVDGATYQHLDVLPHGELSERTQRVLSIGRIATITVTFRSEGVMLPHHGVANLPGDCWLAVEHEGSQ